MNFSATKMNEKYDKKYQIFKECGNMINQFVDKKKDKLETGSYFMKIKELYAILELYEHFDNVFDYIKRRLKAVKEIYDSSDQFNSLLDNLSKSLTRNEEKFQNLLKQYEETLKSFDQLEVVLKDLTVIDDQIKTKLI